MTGAPEAGHRRLPVAAGAGTTHACTATAAHARRRFGAGHGIPVSRRSLAAGFTYIGVLALIALLGMAATLVSELWQTAQKREKERELLFVGNQFRRALAMYSANGGGNPQKLEDLLKDSRVPGVRRFLRKVYRDPITGDTEWGLVRSSGAEGVITGVYSLSGAEPLKQTAFGLADKEFEGKKKYSDWVFTAKPTQGAPGATTPAGSAATTPAGSAATTPAGSGATTPAGSSLSPPAGSGTTTPGGSAATSAAGSGATQSATTPNRAQSRVRR